jgi:hypothetical protein
VHLPRLELAPKGSIHHIPGHLHFPHTSHLRSMRSLRIVLIRESSRGRNCSLLLQSPHLARAVYQRNICHPPCCNPFLPRCCLFWQLRRSLLNSLFAVHYLQDAPPSFGHVHSHTSHLSSTTNKSVPTSPTFIHCFMLSLCCRLSRGRAAALQGPPPQPPSPLCCAVLLPLLLFTAASAPSERASCTSGLIWARQGVCRELLHQHHTAPATAG